MGKSAKVYKMNEYVIGDVVQADIRKRIAKEVNVAALGNSNRSIKDLAVDLINASGEPYKRIAAQCFLSVPTVKKLAEEKTKFPRYDTIERVYRYFGVELKGQLGLTKSEYRNKPKA